MATIAIGDIHGNLPALEDLLGQVRAAVRAGDVVVFLGDYIDRGPDTKGCIDAILQFREAAPCDVVCLCGNHEDWLLRTLNDHRRHSWITGMEAFDTIESYSVAAAKELREAMSAAGLRLFTGDCTLPYQSFVDAIPSAHLHFLRNLTLHHTSADCLCVHGGLDPRIETLAQQPREALLWGTDGFPDQYDGLETVVYGHRNDAEVDSKGWPMPRLRTKTIGIDTIGHGVLTAVRLPGRELLQSAAVPLASPDKPLAS